MHPQQWRPVLRRLSGVRRDAARHRFQPGAGRRPRTQRTRLLQPALHLADRRAQVSRHARSAVAYRGAGAPNGTAAGVVCATAAGPCARGRGRREVADRARSRPASPFADDRPGRSSRRPPALNPEATPARNVRWRRGRPERAAPSGRSANRPPAGQGQRGDRRAGPRGPQAQRRRPGGRPRRHSGNR